MANEVVREVNVGDLDRIQQILLDEFKVLSTQELLALVLGPGNVQDRLVRFFTARANSALARVGFEALAKGIAESIDRVMEPALAQGPGVGEAVRLGKGVAANAALQLAAAGDALLRYADAEAAVATRKAEVSVASHDTDAKLGVARQARREVRQEFVERLGSVGRMRPAPTQRQLGVPARPTSPSAAVAPPGGGLAVGAPAAPGAPGGPPLGWGQNTAAEPTSPAVGGGRLGHGSGWGPLPGEPGYVEGDQHDEGHQYGEGGPGELELAGEAGGEPLAQPRSRDELRALTRDQLVEEYQRLAGGPMPTEIQRQGKDALVEAVSAAEEAALAGAVGPGGEEGGEGAGEGDREPGVGDGGDEEGAEGA